MESTSRSPHPSSKPAPEPPRREPSAADTVMTEYIGYFAGWFDLGQLAVARRLRRSGVRQPLLTDL